MPAVKEPHGARIPKDRRASIAVDLGAESCRVSLLRWIDGRPNFTLVHRFPNGPVQEQDGLHWQFRNIISEVEDGIHRCAALAPEGIRSLAVDGWGVDYVRMPVMGEAAAEPFCYRDERTVRAKEELHRRIAPERLRELTGVQQLRLNTLYQLYSDRLEGRPESRWLQLPEYLLYRLGAEPVAEYTNATHTGLIELSCRTWCKEIFDAADLTIECAPRIVPPGTLLGKLNGALAQHPTLCDVKLIAPACHDTASAIAGIPAINHDWAYISSGTWSLVGTLVKEPMNGPTVRTDDFTNLGAIGDMICFHKSVNGMWLLKQCMSSWDEQGASWTLEALLRAAEAIPAPDALLEVDDPDLLLMGEMPRRINGQRRKRGLPQLNESPNEAPAFASLILRSLAARYAQVLASVHRHIGKPLQRVFVVGGGCRNSMLNRLIAEATGLPIICGSPESSTLGNLAVQISALESNHGASSEAFFAEVAAWAMILNVHEAECTHSPKAILESR
jgi:rhamnulokinase